MLYSFKAMNVMNMIVWGFFMYQQMFFLFVFFNINSHSSSRLYEQLLHGVSSSPVLTFVFFQLNC